MQRRGWRGRKEADRNQLPIDWTASSTTIHAPPTDGGIGDPEPATVAPSPTQASAAQTSRPREPRRRCKTVIARLPVPRPLPGAVAAGRFGHDEKEHPIRPAADEIRAITENPADKLITMLDALVSKPGNPATATALPEAFDLIIAAYGQDFGEAAARQLEAYARRQASLDESDRADSGWQR